MAIANDKSRRVPFTCTLDCGARCELVAHVRDSRVERIDAPAGQPDTDDCPRLIPCLRGRAQHRLLTVPERVLEPLERRGPRGSGSFRSIPWPDALDRVADILRSVVRESGHEAILLLTGAGSIGGRGLTGAQAARRFFSYYGPVTGTYGNMSRWCANMANEWCLGGVGDAIPVAHIPEADLILLWGMNPAENRHGANLAYYVARARDAGAKVVLLDPRYTDSAVLADQWLPLRPGTDVALVAAMVYEMLALGRIDEDDLRAHCSGWDMYRDYVTGASDGTAKTSHWAAAITGLDAGDIRALAADYAAASPGLILAGLGPQRSRFGEQTERALIALAAVSGNLGCRGGGMAHSGRHAERPLSAPSLPLGSHQPGRWIRQENWGRFLLDDSLDPPVQVAYVVAANAINRSSNTRENARALSSLDHVIVQDPYLTPTARYADLVLPVNLDLERPEIVAASGDLYLNEQALDPAGEARTDYWILSQLAERLGFAQDYGHGRDEAAWVDWLLGRMGPLGQDLDAKRVLRAPGAVSVPLADFRHDPVRHPLRTPSGKVEIISAKAVEAGLPAIPSYVPLERSVNHGKALQLVTPHHKLRANSTGYPNPWLLRLEPLALWMNPEDARQRGIVDGQTIIVRNANGQVRVPARLTERIRPGVVSLYQGSWYRPDGDGVDTGGCANVLTSHDVSPTGGMATHSEWVEVLA